MYDIPHIILELLGYQNNNIMKKIKNNTDFIIRPYAGLNIVLTKQKEVFKCTVQSTEEVCIKSNQWVKNINTISRDLFLGEQYSKQIDN